MATGPIGRPPVVGGVRAVRDGERGSERDGANASARAREAGQGGEATDRVTISPEALRGTARGAGDGAGGSSDGAAASASGLPSDMGDALDGGEALLLARAVSGALLANAGVALGVHDMVSPQRVAGLLHG